MAKVRITVSIDEQLLKELDDFCKKNLSVPRSPIIERAIREFLKEKK